ncbi:hypothetical protein RB653_008782 [Dictyostelium firmibasis]|uniref:HTH CENPB-type domain-containing protein n=1 Tax=Dictyostelium firmibasis TaxID=79012 RepID=A0AAN7U154_9MYCE
MSSKPTRMTKDRIEKMSKNERLKAAVEEYLQNQGAKTQKETGKKFRLKEYEISRYINKGPNGKQNILLLKDQEASLIKDLEQLIDQNIAVTKVMVKNMVIQLYKDRTGIIKENISDDWCKKFRKRNPCVKLKSVNFQDELPEISDQLKKSRI